MKKFYPPFLLLLSLITFTQCKSSQQLADEDTREWRYELEAVQTAQQGSYLVKAWTYSKDTQTAKEQAKKNAVHGIIFKGFPNKGRVKGQRPLVNDPEAEEKHEMFFDTFFDQGGDYQKYVTLADHGAIEAGDRIKIGKEYKIGVLTTVNVSELRKRLESEGIIEELGSYFE
jgi:hypothetical protein